MAAVTDTDSTMRATMAGFAKLRPMPPNSSFTTTMATNEPITAMYSGMVEGRLKASSKPVTTADRSPAVWGVLRSRHHRYSNSTQAAVVTAVTSSARQPNITNEAISVGTSAITTFSMTFCVVMPSNTCGGVERTSGRFVVCSI